MGLWPEGPPSLRSRAEAAAVVHEADLLIGSDPFPATGQPLGHQGLGNVFPGCVCNPESGVKEVEGSRRSTVPEAPTSTAKASPVPVTGHHSKRLARGESAPKSPRPRWLHGQKELPVLGPPERPKPEAPPAALSATRTWQTEPLPPSGTPEHLRLTAPPRPSTPSGGRIDCIG